MLSIGPTLAAIRSPQIAILANSRLIIKKFHSMASIVMCLAIRPIGAFFTGAMARFALLAIDVNNFRPILFVALKFA